MERVSKWYFGGLASCGATCFTHPLDTLKVHLQTQQEAKFGLGQMAIKVIRNQGFLALYNGLSASLLRQVTYSTTRFGIYEVLKNKLSENSSKNLSFVQRAFLAGFAGAMGGFVGTPGDMINVRMQYDIKVPEEMRRNYKHALDGLFRVVKEEGVNRLFRGASTAIIRATLMTVGQLSFYDQFKQFFLTNGYLSDNLICHFSSSLSAATVATILTQPVDVIKTRAMNAKPGEFKNIFHIISYTSKMGPLGFYKGFIPAFVRLGPHTVLTFIFFEQLRKNFGVLKDQV